MISPFDKRVGGFTTHYADDERVGELPQPTPLGYEQRQHQKQACLKKQHLQQQQNIAGPSSNALPVQQQCPHHFFQNDNRSNQVLCERIDGNSHIQQYSHTSLFSTPPSSTIIQQNTLLSSSNRPINDSSRYTVTSASVNTTARACAIYHHHHQQQQVVYNDSPVIMATASWSRVINPSPSISSTSGTAPIQLLPTNNPHNSNSINIEIQSPIEKQTTCPISPEKGITTPPFENEGDTEQNLRSRGNNTTKLLSESLSYTMAIARHPPANPKRYAVAKISNVRVIWKDGYVMLVRRMQILALL